LLSAITHTFISAAKEEQGPGALRCAGVGAPKQENQRRNSLGKKVKSPMLRCVCFSVGFPPANAILSWRIFRRMSHPLAIEAILDAIAERSSGPTGCTGWVRRVRPLGFEGCRRETTEAAAAANRLAATMEHHFQAQAEPVDTVGRVLHNDPQRGAFLESVSNPVAVLGPEALGFRKPRSEPQLYPTGSCGSGSGGRGSTAAAQQQEQQSSCNAACRELSSPKRECPAERITLERTPPREDLGRTLGRLLIPSCVPAAACEPPPFA
jgi:hypothetical protein